MAVLAQHVNGAVTPPRFKNPEVSPTLEALILSLLAKNPEERPVSGDVVAKALRDEAEQERLRRLAAGAGRGADGRAVADRGRDGGRPGPGRHAVVPGRPGGAHRRRPRRAAPARRRPPPPAPKPVADAGVGDRRGWPRRWPGRCWRRSRREPLILTADDRYLCGHYLAYLLGGSRREGFFLRRPLDPRNADRARLLLAMTWLMHVGPGEDGANVARAAELLDSPHRRPRRRSTRWSS